VDCTDVIARLSEYLDQEMAEDLRRDIEGHFTDCEGCRVYVVTLQKTIALYRRETDFVCPEQVRIRLHAILAYEYRKK
jgi:predicted anti-sigma-YlaC factor YlaD